MKKNFLIVYYTRTGNTKAVSESLASLLDADIAEIEEKRARRGIWGFLQGSYDALRKKITPVRYAKTPQQYRCVVVATPVWAGTVPSAVRSFCETEKDIIQTYVVLTTQGASHPQRAVRDIETILGKASATCSLRTSLIKKKGYQAHLKDFSYQCKELLKKNTKKRK